MKKQWLNIKIKEDDMPKTASEMNKISDDGIKLMIDAEIENIDIARKYEIIAYVVSRVSQIYQQ